METAIKAIETHYAGCRFRSRLEARWAVFFDTARIKWQYEPQGFELPWRLSGRDGTIRYLPDFWLPELRLWAEVKGSLTAAETLRLMNVAAALSAPDGGCGDGYDTIVLGPVPPATARSVPYRLHMHKGELSAAPWPTSASCVGDFLLGDDTGAPRDTAVVAAIGADLLAGHPFPWAASDFAWYFGALTMARSARFEHGERG